MTTALVRSHASDSDHWYDLSDLVNNTAGGRHGCHCDRRSARATDEHRRATVRRCDVGDDDDGHILWSGALTWSDLALQWEFFGVCVCMSGSMRLRSIRSTRCRRSCRRRSRNLLKEDCFCAAASNFK